MITLEADGSPGAVLPLVLGRIEAQIRAAVPGVTAVRLAAATGPRSPQDPPEVPEAASAGAAQRILDAEINPAIAAHRGHVTIAAPTMGWIRIRLEGGCQGCSLAEVTIRQGIEPLLRARLPGLTGVADVTDHEAGTDRSSPRRNGDGGTPRAAAGPRPQLPRGRLYARRRPRWAWT